MKRDGEDLVIHGLFVDDMQHTSTSQALIDEFMEAYARDFEITGGEVMRTFLGLQVEHVDSEIHLHMDTYVENVPEQYKSFVRRTLRPNKLPNAPNHQLTKDDCPEHPDPKAKFYRSFVMKLQYVATWVRFDISFMASQLASYVSNPGPMHWAALHHLMEYLESYPSFKLVYRRGLRTGTELSGYADSDWGTAVETRRSTTGYISLYNKTPVSWKSKQRQSVALSSAQANTCLLQTTRRRSSIPDPFSVLWDSVKTVYEDN